MSIQEAYNLWAASYDNDHNFTRDLDQQVMESVLENRPGRMTLEIGCGTGKNTCFLSRVSEHVMAIDFSEEMLKQARQKAGFSNIQFLQADLTKPWSLGRASVDRIVCDLVLEHIEDLLSIFSEAAYCLRKGGYFFISELHPFRQYQGGKASFNYGSERIEIDAFMHHISDFLYAARSAGLILEECQEWWHREDKGQPPRLVTFIFVKPRNA